MGTVYQLVITISILLSQVDLINLFSRTQDSSIQYQVQLHCQELWLKSLNWLAPLSKVLGMKGLLGNEDGWPWLLGITVIPGIIQVLSKICIQLCNLTKSFFHTLPPYCSICSAVHPADVPRVPEAPLAGPRRRGEGQECAQVAQGQGGRPRGAHRDEVRCENHATWHQTLKPNMLS